MDEQADTVDAARALRIAQQAVDRLEGSRRITLLERQDFGEFAVWDAPAFCLRGLTAAPPAALLAEFLDSMSEHISEQAHYWGRAFPPCPGHRHPARISCGSDRAQVELSCPVLGVVFARITPSP